MEIAFDRIKPLSPQDLTIIHTKTVEILSHTGLRVDDEHAREIFKQHGFTIEGQIVHFPEQAIENALQTTPSSFTVLARNPRYNLIVGGDSYAFAPTGISPFFMDHNSKQRPATTEDYIKFLKLVHHFDCIGFNRQVVTLEDVPREKMALYWLLLAIQYNEKPLDIRTADEIEMICMLFGITREKMKREAERGIAYCFSGINPFSPLTLTRDQCDRLIKMCEYKIPIVFASMPIAGVNAPTTLPGLIVLQNCEVMGSIVFSQLLNPGTPVVYGFTGTITNMRNGAAPVGPPEARVIEYASAQLARFYGLPSRGDGGMTDSLCYDYQSGAEAALNFYNAIRCGINMIPGCGELGSWMHGSLEKFVLDAEVIGYVKRIMQPLEFTRENLAIDLIKLMGNRSNYITQRHTLSHYKSEFYEPGVFQRTLYDRWCQQGRKEIGEVAHEKVIKILDSYQKPFLDPVIEQDLKQYVGQYPV